MKNVLFEWGGEKITFYNKWHCVENKTKIMHCVLNVQ